jgi:hypothetical protein
MRRGAPGLAHKRVRALVISLTCSRVILLNHDSGAAGKCIDMPAANGRGK